MDPPLSNPGRLPGFWSRWSLMQRRKAAIGLTVASLSLSAISLLSFRWLNHFYSIGPHPFGDILFAIFLAGINLGCALIGAFAIAGERDHHTWEALLMTSLGVRGIVKTIFRSRLQLCLTAVLLTLPLLLTWGYCLQRSWTALPGDYLPSELAKIEPIPIYQRAIYLIWLTVRLVGRILPFLTLGMAISACCKTVKTAVIITVGIVLGGCFALFHFGVYGEIPNEHLPVYWLLGWPLLSNEYCGYSTNDIIAQWIRNGHWYYDLLSDILWLCILPVIFYRLAVRFSQRVI